MNVTGFIFARGGSKGIPNKNIIPLHGKPLIHYSIETAKKSRFIKEIIVSTDSIQIAECAKQAGAKVPFMRPAELAQDNTAEWNAWQHALEELKKQRDIPYPDVFVSLPTTSPLRSVQDVDACIEKLLNSDADMVITITPTTRHPAFNMVRVEPSGEIKLAMSLEKKVIRRQDVPFQIFDMTTVAYVSRPSFIMNAQGIFEGKLQAVMIPTERAIDIDTPLDLEMAEFLLQRQEKLT
ncbi:MAG: acylneuraminate cytidylyltransferase family protein [SAR324 cluster bacterium]|nr:acylneuraminate cytidylyltransferase family protein [SAR324 cluster bacterium]MBF0351782.1 acylneuraminate cytidylyltransferase family protein [SAR324 cluster bacterium]